MSSRTTQFRALVAVAVLVLSSSACAADPDPEGRSPVVGAGGGTIETSVSVEAIEFKFIPEVWLVAANTETPFEIVNNGGVEHNWVLIAQGSEVSGITDIQALTPADILFEQAVLLAGQSATDSFTTPAVGTYQVICSVPGHFESGMKGTLQTAEGGST